MARKYASALEEHQICSKTGAVWTIDDVPALWRTKVVSQVIADGYVFDEEGHAVRPIIEVTGAESEAE